MRFAGKTVLVSGAAQGLGAATAQAFQDEGAILVLGDIAEIPNAPPTRTVYGDVADPAYARQLVNLAIEQTGRLDIAVNNAGILHTPAPIPEIDEAEARRVIEVDLLGVFWALQAQMPAIKGGAIVNIASAAGLHGAPTLGAYSAAKHGVAGLTKTAALEGARDKTRVNAICPSFAATAMVGEAATDPEAEKQMTRGIPLRRLATIPEVVQAILWAADPANSFMTGQCIGIDGGLGAV